MASAVSTPRGPSPTFEHPELAATARRRPSSASRDTITGAPTRAFVVKRAAETVSGSLDATTPTSSPSGLMPAATPAARNPAGSPCGSSSVTCPGASTQRDLKNVTRALRLGEAEHQVQVLHGLAGGALPEVVDRGQHDHAAADHAHVDAAAVGLADVVGARRLVGEVDEGLVLVGAAIQVEDGVALEVRRHVATGEQALLDRHEVRHEREAGLLGQLLLKLGGVPVALDLVGLDVLGDRDEVRRLGGLAAGSRDARLGVHHHVGDVLAQRPERQQRGGRVAAGGGHEVRAADLFAVRLREAVDGLVEQLGRLVLCVPALVALAVEAEVGREVHDLEAALAQRLHRRRRRAVRVGHDRGVRPLRDRVGVELLERHRHAVARVELVVAAPRVRASRDRSQL